MGSLRKYLPRALYVPDTLLDAGLKWGAEQHPLLLVRAGDTFSPAVDTCELETWLNHSLEGSPGNKLTSLRPGREGGPRGRPVHIQPELLPFTSLYAGISVQFLLKGIFSLFKKLKTINLVNPPSVLFYFCLVSFTVPPPQITPGLLASYSLISLSGCLP